MRIGAKKRPFYRVVVVDEQAKRTGAYIELLGTYNPLTEPKDIKLKQDRIDHWTKQGAQPSTGYLRIIGKAPQRPPRKPKKEKKEVPVTQAETPPTSQPAETIPTSEPTTEATQETPKEDVKPESSKEEASQAAAEETRVEETPVEKAATEEVKAEPESEKKDEGSA